MSLLDVHAKLQFQTLAPLLGLVPTAKYTVNAKCPYCGAHAWSIYQDNRNLEEWYYCSQCKASGSVLAMAAEHLGVSEAEVLDVLSAQLNLSIAPADRRAFEINQDYRRRFQAAWAEAQENMKYIRQPQYQYLHNMGWQRPATMGIDRFLEGPCQLFGMLTPEAVREYLSHKRAFVKTHPMMAVVPYFRTPTDIGGFACFPNHREVFVTCPQTHAMKPFEGYLTGEIGFVGLPLLDQLQSQHLIVTSMLSPMIMLQMKNFNSSKVPLPLLAARYYGTSQEKQWSSLGGRNLILWERKPTAAMLHQAMMTNAAITFLGPGSNRPQLKESIGTRWWNWVHHEPATDTMAKLIRNSRPYTLALENWGRSASWEEKSGLLKEAEQYATIVYDLVYRTLKPGIKSKFGRRITVPTLPVNPGSEHLVGYTVVVERDGCWMNRSGHIRLAGILRVEHLVVRENHREYVGYLQVDEKRIDFRVPVNKAKWAYLSELALENGVLLRSERCSNQHYNQKSENFCPFDAACRFEPPKVVRGLERIGWDGEGFQFRNTRLVNGVFHQIPDFIFAANVPGPTQSHCRLTDDVRESLSRNSDEMEATWALAIAIAAQVTAPCVKLPVYGIWIQRPKIDLGLSTLYNRMEIRRGDYKTWPHNWPRRLDEMHNVQRYDSTGFFVLTAPRPRKSGIRDVIVIDLQTVELQPRLFSHSADKIVLNYLRHFTQLPQQKKTDWKTWLEFTCQQFHEVFSFAAQERIIAAVKRLTLC